ncbi:phosphotransferase enzyme family protein [Ilyonectria robusta]|uniref:phosphotransferase enzyme family protein n=1 Tax=Ilyonectria robusta TaxID=1079257 RepID=UPI001E8DC66A|nr:phosphotransferase enzyme family protein [Ilyonectria robusta]KAH8661724.1 phosphotransferase enzyme family protein [Ilyonectria robusta]
MHMAQLLFQHNDLVPSEDDCRNKFVARQLFHTLAKQGRLSTFGFVEDNWSAQSNTLPSNSSAPNGSDSFRLCCDDFRPANILLNQDDNILAIIDWDVYDMRLETWLSAMEDAEESIEPDSLPFKLSTYMRESWENGRFWLNYAARKSWAFDTVFWKYLDERFFGTRERNVPEHELWKTRIDLLGEGERRAMEPFVKRKMEESKERILMDWNPAEAKKLVTEILLN